MLIYDIHVIDATALRLRDFQYREVWELKFAEAF